MDVSVPAYLRQNILRYGFGVEGMRWLDDLPQQIASVAQEWGLHVGPPFDKDGAVSWVAPVELSSGAEAVLKMTLPHDEARFEAHALRFLDGLSTVRLLDACEDGFTLLLERCRPGTELWSLGEMEGNAVASRMLPHLWRNPEPDAPFGSLADSVARWWHDLPRITARRTYDEDIVAEAIARGRELVASQPQRVLLHGDFHPGNVLAAEREPWLCIDPKPLIGEPAYDLAQWLFNRARFVPQSDEGVAILRRQIERFAVDLGLNPARIASWAFVKALGMDFGPEYVALLQQVAHTW